MKKGFSLIEVLFAITFLILVGVAMATLNNAASKLTAATELKETALSLNEQSLSFIALEKRTKSTFTTLYSGCVAGQTCYVNCPVDTSQNCSLQTTKVAVTVGKNKLQFVPSVVIRPSGASGRYLVNATVSWGTGIQRQLTLARVIE